MITLLDREDLLFNPPESGCVLSLTGLPGGSNKIYDRSPYHDLGTITGASWLKLPNGLWCLSFDGVDDVVSFVANSSLDIVGDITILLWFNTGDNKSTQFPMGRGTTGAVGWRIELGNGTLFQFTVGNGTDLTADTKTSTMGVWNFGVCRRSGAEVEVFINGVGSGSPGTLTGSIDYTGVGLAIGHRSIPVGNAARYFHGQIALPRIYNRALSALEIKNRFDQEKHLFGVW